MKKFFASRTVVNIAALGTLLAARIALAQATPPVPLPQSPLDNASQIQNLLCAMLGWVFWGLIVLAIIMFLVGGYRYATSSGEPENVKTANKILLFATIAVAVALLAEGIPYVIGSFIGSEFGAGVC
jgi:hypothetical protein